jgi:hypothetical protein
LPRRQRRDAPARSGALGLNVVDVLLAIRDAARDGAAIAIAQQA